MLITHSASLMVSAAACPREEREKIVGSQYSSTEFFWELCVLSSPFELFVPQSKLVTGVDPRQFKNVGGFLHRSGVSTGRAHVRMNNPATLRTWLVNQLVGLRPS